MDGYLSKFDGPFTAMKFCQSKYKILPKIENKPLKIAKNF